MKVLFNCSDIRNVYLRHELLYIELEITYTVGQNKACMSRHSIDGVSDKQYQKERYEKAYNTIKQALLNKEPFVEIEL